MSDNAETPFPPFPPGPAASLYIAEIKMLTARAEAAEKRADWLYEDAEAKHSEILSLEAERDSSRANAIHLAGIIGEGTDLIESLEAERDKVLANMRDEVVQSIMVREQLAAANAECNRLKAWSALAAHKIVKWGQGMTDADWREAEALVAALGEREE